MLNREVFVEDPTTRDLPNLGVARVSRPESEQEWETLHFELSHFVCEGEYERGLDRILSTYLAHLDQPKQPGVWVSGFYGSGKSHFLRVLENIWVDSRLPNGGTARGISHLASSVEDDLRELTIAGKRGGGLWAAAGTLGTGASGSVRLAFLRVLFEAAGLPAQYAPARFVIWLKQQGIYEAVSAAVERHGKTLAREVNNLYVAQALPQALLEVRPDFAEDAAAVRLLLKEQFPTRMDVDEDEAMRAARDVFELQSDTPGRLPLTLIVLDEMQQYLGEDAQKTLDVDALAQAVSAEFESQVLLVAAGQSAMGATPALQKLKDRFTVYVQLSDTDVETVIRKVVLQKKPDKQADLKAALDNASGEIGRQLGGTKLAATSADAEYLVADYPMLPTRRRFWEHVLRALDKGGTQGALRTQLRMAHEAAKSVGHEALGNVVGADFIYDQQASGMLQSGVLLKDTNEQILRLRQDGLEGELQSRIAALVFMIDRLAEVNSELGVTANAETIGDLLVTDLTSSSVDFRTRVSDHLKAMAEAGLLAVTDGHYALVDEETQRWLGEYKQNGSAVAGDAVTIAAVLEEHVRGSVGDALRNFVLTHGKSKTPRRLELNFGSQPPASQGTTVPVWVRGEWDVTEKRAREEANELGNESPVVTVLLPKGEYDALRTQVIRYVAARKTVDDRPMPATEEGMRARKTIESERDSAGMRIKEIMGRILAGAHVFLPAGSDEAPGSLKLAVQAAAEKALVRLFPRFEEADHGSWSTVSTRVLDGAGDALGAVSYQGSPDKHPVCAEILGFVKASGTRGTEVRQKFEGVGFGWPQDAVNAALLVLLQAGHLAAELNGTPTTAGQLTLAQVGKANYRRESVLPPSTEQLIQLRALLTKAEIAVKSGEELAGVSSYLQKLIDAASEAGGDPPLPPKPDTSMVRSLQELAGNELLHAVFEKQMELEGLYRRLSAARREIGLRVPRWDRLKRLMAHAGGLSAATEVESQAAAIVEQRSLLLDPDPVLPLLDSVQDALRATLAQQVAAFKEAREEGIDQLHNDESFKALSDERKKSLVEEFKLRSLDMPPTDTDQALLTALDAVPLEAWRDKTDGLAKRFEQAREAAAREAVQAVKVSPRPATLKDAAAVDAYVEDLRQEMLKHVEGGHPVVI